MFHLIGSTGPEFWTRSESWNLNGNWMVARLWKVNWLSWWWRRGVVEPLWVAVPLVAVVPEPPLVV